MNFSRSVFTDSPASLSVPFIALIVLMMALFTLGPVGTRVLSNPDEGRYSEISREMAASGDFVTPRLNGLKYFEKPPLQYWATAISFKLLGVSDLAARLYVALCGLGCVLLIAFAGARLYDAETGMLAAFILLASPYFTAISQIVTLDIGVTFWLTFTLVAFLLSQVATDARGNRNWLITAWAAAAGAMLSKGLIGVVFPAATVFVYCVLQRDFKLLLRLQWVWGLLVFLALATPWFVLVQMQNPEFAQFFFIHEHWERFTSDTHRRVGAWWYFVPILLAGLLAWLIAFFPAVWSGLRDRGIVIHARAQQKPFKPLLFLLIFCGFVFVFFSKSGSKLPGYIAPLFPALALVLAVYVRNAVASRLAWLVLPTALIGAGATYWLWMAPASLPADDFALPAYGTPALLAAIVLAVAAIAAFVLLRWDRKLLATFVLALGTLLAMEGVAMSYEKISSRQSGFAVAEVIKKKLTPETRLYTVKTYDQSLPHYLQRTLTMVEYVDEFELGQKQEPAKYVDSIAKFSPLWNAPGAAIALIQPNGAAELRALGLNFEVIHQDPRRAVIFKK